MIKHTQGPWNIANKGNEVNGFIAVETAKGKYILCDGLTEQEKKANAALIITAPDLLEALKEAEALYSEYGLQANPKYADRVGPWINATRQAINKAENKEDQGYD